MVKQKIFSKPLLVLNVLAAIASIGIFIKIVGLPFYAESMFKERYMDLVFECDHSMREHMIAKNQFLVEPNDQNERILESSEVGLISCHDYDSLRKKMLVYGLSEDQLSDIGLDAIEENIKEADEVLATVEGESLYKVFDDEIEKVIFFYVADEES